MTTIAAKTGVMWADTQLTGPGGCIYRTTKIVRLPDGGVAGGAGDWTKAYAALCWLAKGEHGDPPDIESTSILIYRPDLTLWVADEAWPAFPLLDEFAAIGCGAQAAMALMGAGKSAMQAVAAVLPVDSATSDPLQSLKVRRK